MTWIGLVTMAGTGVVAWANTVTRRGSWRYQLLAAALGMVGGSVVTELGAHIHMGRWLFLALVLGLVALILRADSAAVRAAADTRHVTRKSEGAPLFTTPLLDTDAIGARRDPLRR